VYLTLVSASPVPYSSPHRYWEAHRRGPWGFRQSVVFVTGGRRRGALALPAGIPFKNTAMARLHSPMRL
jgi:hypothetical protein